MCLKRLDILAQNTLTIIGSIVNMIEKGGGGSDHVKCIKISNLIKNKIFI